MRDYDMPWRPVFELYAMLAWAASLVVMVGVLLTTSLPSTPFMVMAAMSLAIMARRAFQTKALLDFKVTLAGKAFSYISATDLSKKMRAHKGVNLWMGYGFLWTPVHTQRANHARKIDIRKMLPPAWYLQLKKIPPASNVVGQPWIHGLDASEADINIPLEACKGHNIVFGTTGSGKTRMLETLIYQAVHRGEVVFIIDPKGDRELKEITQQACVTAGRPDAFVYFNPTFPAQSIRIDPLRNWSRETQIASRVVMLMSNEDGGTDGFVAFAWRTINAVNNALLYVGERPNLRLIDKYVAGGPDELMMRCLRRYFNDEVPNWESMSASYVEKARTGKLPTKAAPGTSPELIGLMMYYKTLPTDGRPQAVDKLLEIAEHPREHYSKVITNVLPWLAILNSGELGPLLSPDANNIDDERPIFDTEKLIRGKHVVYIGLDTLSDQTVGQALGSILLADLAATAGAIYNSEDLDHHPIKLFVDEAAEVVNKPLVQILNKGRGAGFEVWLFAQTYPDFVNRMGSDEAARMILGNCNNLVALRTKDRVTQDFIVETFGETMIQQRSVSHGSGSKSEDTGMEFSGTVSESVSETSASVFAPELLGMLPNLQFMAMAAGGKLYKGRLPKLQY